MIAMWFGKMRRWARTRERTLVYATGVILICVWTLLRFFTKRTIFDLVSQQVVVNQWLHGSVSTAHMGQTAYVLKMLLLYVPLDLLPGSPRLKLILLTLVINGVTFILIGLITERMLRYFHVRISWALYAGLLWLGVIAGSVFWIEFANSRNLEVAGGLLLLYLGLQFLRFPSRRLGLLILALGSILFFSDPLQIYMTALPLVLYAVGLAMAKRESRRLSTGLLGLLLIACIGARIMFLVTGHWLHITFSDTGNTAAPHVSVLWLKQSIEGLIQSVVSLLAGANDAGRLREVVNMLLALFGVAGIVYTTIRRQAPRQLLLLVGCICVTDSLIYIASGQAAQGASTDRYLIMIIPALILAAATIRLPKIALRPSVALAGAALTLSAIALGATLATHWTTTFPADKHLESVYTYTRGRPGTHVYASADTAMPLLYLHSLPAEAVLPVGCLHGSLVQTHYAMDQDFWHDATTPHTPAAIVLDGDSVANAPNVCTPNSISRQLGPPQAIEYTNDGSTVLLYSQAALHLPA